MLVYPLKTIVPKCHMLKLLRAEEKNCLYGGFFVTGLQLLALC